MTLQYLVKKFRDLKEQVILKVADQTDELRLNSWCGFRKYFLWLRKVFKSFSTTSTPPVEAFLHQPVIPCCLLASVPRQPLYCLLTILLHPALLCTSTLGSKEPPETCFLTSCHLFQPRQFHFCSVYVKIRPDPCIIDTIVIHWRISEHDEEADLICSYKNIDSICVYGYCFERLIRAKLCEEKFWNWWGMWKKGGWVGGRSFWDKILFLMSKCYFICCTLSTLVLRVLWLLQKVLNGPSIFFNEYYVNCQY